jgi:subtilisin family serine protease
MNSSQFKKIRLEWVAVGTFLLLGSSCDSTIDDQRILKNQQRPIVNPDPTARDFKSLQSQHKVKVAILDSGVDYNHPLLRENIHFQLDPEGKPLGTGYDYAGEDPWPAPYVGRTDFFNPELSQQDRYQSLRYFQANKLLLQSFPHLEAFFPKERSHEEESQEGIEHGTHVAGLASFDAPEIGILPYRVIPVNRAGPNTPEGNLPLDERFAQILLKSIDRAVRDGANVINMSLGLKHTKNDSLPRQVFFRGLQDALVARAKKYPDVLFVAAAGNDGKWLDGRTVASLPCYIPAPNVVCVGALSRDETPTSFTNLVIAPEVTTIFAWGEDILSTIPTQQCQVGETKFTALPDDPEARAKFGEEITKKCFDPAKKPRAPLLAPMSGTSMASPVVARALARIKAKNPMWSAVAVKEELLKRSTSAALGALRIARIKMETPSWYREQGTPMDREGAPARNQREPRANWDFVIPDAVSEEDLEVTE